MSSPGRREPTVIEQIFIALIGGEPDAVVALIHPQAEWTPTHWSGGHTYKGPEGVRQWMAQFGSALEYLDHRVERMQIEGDRGAVQATVFDSREGVMFAVRVSWSFELEEGLVRRACAHDSWEEALQAVGLAEGASR